MATGDLPAAPPATPLNPGVVRTVQWLNENGFETCDSGDGVTHDFECDRHYPYVVIITDPARLAADADRLLALLRTRIRVDALAEDSPEDAVNVTATYDPADGFAIIEIANVTDRVLWAGAN